MAGYDDAGRYRVPVSSPDQEGNVPEPSKQRAGSAQWVCLGCGVVRWGGVGIATWHKGTCDICGESGIAVTEPRDFGRDLDHGEAIDKAAAPDCQHAGSTTEESSAVHIPLDVQKRLFEAYYADALDKIYSLLDTAEVELCARSRFREGYELYGSDAFTWTPEHRRRECIEEIADAACYLVTGSIGSCPSCGDAIRDRSEADA